MTDSPLAGRRVLVIEDEMIVAMLLEDMLADLGCTVLGPAARVDQALTIIAAAGSLDAAVLDVNLNGQKSYPERTHSSRAAYPSSLRPAIAGTR